MNKSPPDASNSGSGNDLETQEIQRLVGAARDGDEAAFGVLVQKYQQRVFSVVYQFVNNVDDANELAQQTWIKVWRKLHTFKGKSEFFTWVYRIASFVSLDYLRKRKRKREDELLDELEPRREVGAEPAASSNPRPDRQVEQAEIRVRFEEALEQLSAEHRMILVLREVEGLSYEEIAKTMKCRKGTVMSRLYYARKAIQAYMEEVR